MQCQLNGATLTSRGSLVVNTFVQEDCIVTPDRREVSFVPPMLMNEETAETIFHATHHGFPGQLFRHVLESLHSGQLRSAIIFDNADCAATNLKAFRYVHSHILQEANDLRCFVRFVRCDGHMYHIAASIPLARAGCSSALYSAALLMRSSSNKWALHSALHRVLKDELVWLPDGEDPRPEDIAYNKLVLEHTLLRHAVPESEPVEGSAAQRRANKLQNFAQEVLRTLNGNWRAMRVSHRCTRRPDGRLCCPSRSAFESKISRSMTRQPF